MSTTRFSEVPELKFRDVDIEVDVGASMRDGTVLHADIYRPRGCESLPILLMRTPYDKSTGQNAVYHNPAWYARFGYIVVVQDCRGRMRSEGEFYPYRHEEQDTVDTIEWAARLPGGNGSVATYGFSYPGALQLLGASRQPAPLKTIMPAMTSSDFFEGWTYQGGAFCQAFIQSWVSYLACEAMRRANDEGSARKIGQLQMQIGQLYACQRLDEGLYEFKQYMPYYFDWLEHDRYDDYWKDLAVRERYETIKVPALHIGGWYDSFAAGTIENFSRLHAMQKADGSRGRQKLLMGPWFHLPWHQHSGAVDFGSNARNFVNNYQINWLERYLKGGGGTSGGRRSGAGLGTAGAAGDMADCDSGEAEDKDVSVFVLFADRWDHFDNWPPKSVNYKAFYLHSGGGANSLAGDGSLSEKPPAAEPWDTYTYHPLDPVPSRGGHSCCIDVASPMGAHDQRMNEFRNDVLVYSTPVLESDLLLTGEVKAKIFAASNCCDTDFTATLVAVAPCGTAINIVNGIVRASYRNSLSKPEPIVPGEVYEYEIKVGSTAALIKAGHSLRLEISSSNFPHFDRSSNDSVRLGYNGFFEQKVARQTVFHDDRYPSCVMLPVCT